jgi:glutaconate CoA-transferase subunit A
MLKPSLDELVAPITPGTLLAIPRDYSGVAMAATRALMARGIRGLRLLAVPTSGIQADILIGAGCVAELEAAAVSLGESGAGPRFVDAIKRRAIVMRDTTCPAVHSALQAAEKGIPFIPMRGLIGTDILAHRKDWRVMPNPFATGGDPIVLLPAIQPDVALFHAPKADRNGNLWIGRRRELATMAHAAKLALATVEEIVDTDFLAEEASAAGALPAMYVGAIAVARRGAWPLGCLDLYEADGDELARYAQAARTAEGFGQWLAGYLAAPARSAA